jgi:pyridoxal/pyridoxine/pyridoxamine kinase
MSEEQRFPDNVLFQRIEQIFMPAQNWQTCEQPMLNQDLIREVNTVLPGFFESPEKIMQIMEQLHFRYELNEHNRKWYWLINPAESRVVYL